MFFLALRLREEEEAADSASPRPLTRLIIFLAADTEVDLLTDCLFYVGELFGVVKCALCINFTVNK